ncbi:YeiH family protein [Pararhizobium haloflavum]|uniref:YeiH family protein n=1 Tax=Pararhizobium haloflavum TaxID=2037914 RepID=UPI000C1A4C61|nr:putative sulfate exporter family transporter [Pararhizobium haloflavum]
MQLDHLSSAGNAYRSASRLTPGFLICATVAVAAQFLADHHGAPVMLLALMLGIALHFLSDVERASAGIEYTARRVLRIGVALLGARITPELMAGIDVADIALVTAAVAAVILFALAAAWALNRGWRLAILTGGAVAICGASAAMAIAAVLPSNDRSERNLTFTVIGVTVLSTVAMIVYPLMCAALGLDDRTAGVFIGGTIHDVAQVVGAGFSVSEETGETATLVKMLRVIMLAPTVICLSLVFRGGAPSGRRSAGRAPLVPRFVLVFISLAALNASGLLPRPVAEVLVALSGWALVLGIAAIGMKTSLSSLSSVGTTAIVLLVAETVFMAAIVLGGLLLIGQGSAP